MCVDVKKKMSKRNSDLVTTYYLILTMTLIGGCHHYPHHTSVEREVESPVMLPK